VASRTEYVSSRDPRERSHITVRINDRDAQIADDQRCCARVQEHERKTEPRNVAERVRSRLRDSQLSSSGMKPPKGRDRECEREERYGEARIDHDLTLGTSEDGTAAAT
jgi:hypothetical protein